MSTGKNITTAVGNNITTAVKATTTLNDTIQSITTSLTSDYTTSTNYDDYRIVTNTPFTWIDTDRIQTGTTTGNWSFVYNNNNNEKEKENKMNNEFNFGPYDASYVRLSPYGIAVRNKNNKWVSYDKETQTLIDVDIININIDSKKVFFKIPKSVSSVDIGDIVLHNDTPVFVEEVKGNKFVVINPYEGTELTIIAPTSPYGYSYLPVIISLTDFFPIADNDNPFGNLLPVILAENGNNASVLMALLVANKDIDVDPMFLLACGSGNVNPYLLMALQKNNNLKPKYANEEARIIGEKIEAGRKRAAQTKKSKVD